MLRYRLRTLLIALALVPPLLALTWLNHASLPFAADLVMGILFLSFWMALVLSAIGFR